jgi:DNA-binding HxlR family transcriptional regulator
MKKIKESSTFQMNNNTLLECPVSFTISKIGGRWKTIILYTINNWGPIRFNQLKKYIPNITEKMLTQQLRELEVDNLVIRDVKPVVPPHVEYSLTLQSQSLAPIFDEMAKWGRENNEKYKECN